MSSAKCQADMTPVLLHWTVDDHVPVLKWDGVQRSCVDWEGLMKWGDEHSMTHSETMPSVSSMHHFFLLLYIITPVTRPYLANLAPLSQK